MNVFLQGLAHVPVGLTVSKIFTLTPESVFTVSIKFLSTSCLCTIPDSITKRCCKEEIFVAKIPGSIDTQLPEVGNRPLGICTQK